MASQNRHELARLRSVLEADRVLVGTSQRLRKLSLTECAEKVERLRLELADLLAPIQDEAYAALCGRSRKKP
jgi:hypothetical protein